MDSLYCSDQIEVPPQLPAILKAWAKEVIRYQPQDITTFSKDYFTALSSGDISSWLDNQSRLKQQQKSSSVSKSGEKLIGSGESTENNNSTS